MSALAVTVDVEDWYHQPWITGAPWSRFKSVEDFFSRWGQRYDYLSGPTRQALDLLERMSLKATFFVVADVVEHYPGLVEAIAEKGHEIACHGLHHACKIHPATREPLVSRDEFEDRTLRAKTALESASGQEVVGYRAPNALVGGWMLDSLEKIGFKYDSSVSVNSIYNKTDSHLKGVGTAPYFPLRTSLEPGSARGILEIPWPYFRLGLKFPTGGGPLLRTFGARYIMAGLKQSLKRGNTIFYFHPIDIGNEKLPWNLSLKQSLLWRTKGDVVQRRIQHILGELTDTQVRTCREIAEGWGTP